MDERMREVTKDEFFAALAADRRDIRGHIIGTWDNQAGYLREHTVAITGQVWGRSTSGDAEGQDHGKQYWLRT